MTTTQLPSGAGRKIFWAWILGGLFGGFLAFSGLAGCGPPDLGPAAPVSGSADTHYARALAPCPEPCGDNEWCYDGECVVDRCAVDDDCSYAGACVEGSCCYHQDC